jgi:hypothetical protein
MNISEKIKQIIKQKGNVASFLSEQRQSTSRATGYDSSAAIPYAAGPEDPYDPGAMMTTPCGETGNYGTFTTFQVYIEDTTDDGSVYCLEYTVDDSWMCCSSTNNNSLNLSNAFVLPHLGGLGEEMDVVLNQGTFCYCDGVYPSSNSVGDTCTSNSAAANNITNFRAWLAGNGFDTWNWAETYGEPWFDITDECPSDYDVFVDTDNDGVGDSLEVLGCTNPDACNYNISANSDDGSCTMPNECNSCTGDETCIGCTDSTALNYDEDHTFDDGSCYFNPGCDDPEATNFDDAVDFNDGSCCYVAGCQNPGYLEYDPEACDGDDEDYCLTISFEGCMDEEACNYNENANIDDDSCWYPEIGYTCENECQEGYVDINEEEGGPSICVAGVVGCTDSDACNYDPEANIKGPCDYPEDLYGDGFLCDGTCDETGEYWDTPYITTTEGEDTVCVVAVLGCMDELYLEYDPAANYDDDNQCINLIVTGCTDETACNYVDGANDDDGSCTYPEEYYDCDGNPINDTDGDGIPDELEVAGCTDSTATNYNPDATDDDDSCCYVSGCTDPTMSNYNADACEDDGSCLEFIYGCTDDTSLEDGGPNNYDGSANTNCTDPDTQDGCTPCYYPVYGCTNPSAPNYNEAATDNDGSCLGGGCTDESLVSLWSQQAACQEYVNTDGAAGNPCVAQTIDNLAADNDLLYDQLVATFAYDGGVDSDFITNFVWYQPYWNNPNANCGFTTVILGCMNSDALNYNPNANFELNNFCQIGINGCMDVAACNYNSNANIQGEECIYPPEGFGIDECGEIPGCTDENAANWLNTATVDDGSCEYTTGCMDTTACSGNYPGGYDPLADIPCNSGGADGYDNDCCDYTSCIGCGDPNACNYDGCGYEEFDFDGDGDMEDIPCESFDNSACNFDCYGCTDQTAYNYDSIHTQPYEIIEGYFDGDTWVNSILDTSLTATCCLNYGCICQNTSLTNCEGNAPTPADGFDVQNVNWDGNFDCACTDPDTQFTSDGDGFPIPCTPCIAQIEGCMDDTSGNNPDTLGNCADGTVAVDDTCPDNTGYAATNYDPNANYDDQEEWSNCVYPVEGCTDETASNYDINATVDDGNCEYIETEYCEDSEACNYLIAAGGTTYDTNNLALAPCNYDCYGCTDMSACNNGQNSDGEACLNLEGEEMLSCVNLASECLQPCDIYDCSGGALDCDGNALDVYGCTDEAADNYDENADVNDGSCIYPQIAGCLNPNASCGDDYGIGVEGDADFVLGYYNLAATLDCAGTEHTPIFGNDYDFTNPEVDTGCCDLTTCSGCMDDTMSNYDASATSACNDCCIPFVDGCMTVGALNFDCASDELGQPTEPAEGETSCNDGVNNNDGTCLFAPDPIYGCLSNPDAPNYDCVSGNTNYPCSDGVTVDDGSCLPSPIPGCTDSSACNYNPSANQNDGSCDYGVTCSNGTTACNEDECPDIACCQDPAACNTNNSPSCTSSNNALCNYPSYECWNGSIVCYQGQCPPEPEVEGCTDSNAYNYNPGAQVDDGSCKYCRMVTAVQCDPTLPSQLTEQTEISIPCLVIGDDTPTMPPDGNGEFLWAGINVPDDYYGCTDPQAENYNSNAVEDDGSCNYGPDADLEMDQNYGCTDPEANNYDEDATADNGSCTYDTNPWDGYEDIECAWCPGTYFVQTFGGPFNQSEGYWYPVGFEGEPPIAYIPGLNSDNCQDYLPWISDLATEFNVETLYNMSEFCANANPEYSTPGNPADTCMGQWWDGEMSDCDPLYGLGCTDPDADNYNEWATINDNSCIYSGCNDPNAVNYDSNATTDADCYYFPCQNACEVQYGITAWYETYNCSGYNGCVNFCENNFAEFTNNGCCGGDYQSDAWECPGQCEEYGPDYYWFDGMGCINIPEEDFEDDDDGLSIEAIITSCENFCDNGAWQDYPNSTYINEQAKAGTDAPGLGLVQQDPAAGPQDPEPEVGCSSEGICISECVQNNAINPWLWCLPYTDGSSTDQIGGVVSQQIDEQDDKTRKERRRKDSSLLKLNKKIRTRLTKKLKELIRRGVVKGINNATWRVTSLASPTPAMSKNPVFVPAGSCGGGTNIDPGELPIRDVDTINTDDATFDGRPPVSPVGSGPDSGIGGPERPEPLTPIPS